MAWQKLQYAAHQADIHADGNYYEFNGDVKSADLLNEKISGNPADVPLIQLYSFLKQHCKNYAET